MSIKFDSGEPDVPQQLFFRVEEQRYAPPCDENGDPYPGARGDLKIKIYAYPVVKRTPKGWKLNNGVFVGERFHKKWAWPSIDEAFESFYARKEKQISIYRHRALDALEAREGAKMLQKQLTEMAETKCPSPLLMVSAQVPYTARMRTFEAEAFEAGVRRAINFLQRHFVVSDTFFGNPSDAFRNLEAIAKHGAP